MHPGNELREQQPEVPATRHGKSLDPVRGGSGHSPGQPGWQAQGRALQERHPARADEATEHALTDGQHRGTTQIDGPDQAVRAEVTPRGGIGRLIDELVAAQGHPDPHEWMPSATRLDGDVRGPQGIPRRARRSLGNDPPCPDPGGRGFAQPDQLRQPANAFGAPPRTPVRTHRHVLDQAQRLHRVAPRLGGVRRVRPLRRMRDFGMPSVHPEKAGVASGESRSVDKATCCPKVSMRSLLLRVVLRLNAGEKDRKIIDLLDSNVCS